MKLIPIYICAALCLTTGCIEKSTTDTKISLEDSANTEVADTEIYDLGHKAGESMLRECTDIEQIENRLLDTRARINLIRGSVDDQAASDYSRGFTDAIRENCDSLAQKLEL